MSEGIQITVTTQTAQAAAQLKTFFDQVTAGLEKNVVAGRTYDQAAIVF